LLEQLISEQIQNFKIPIGGTSAGMILSEFVYIGNSHTTTSSEVLADFLLSIWDIET